MNRRKYKTPILMIESGGPGEVVGDGTGQGSFIPGDPEPMTYDEWWIDIACEGENMDADYNGDGAVNEDDYTYYIDNKLWKG